VEATIPTLAILVSVRVLSPVNSLFQPTVYMYFIFIFFSALQLRFWLSVFSGFVSCVGYLATALVFLRTTAEPSGLTDDLTNMAHHVAKGVMLLTAGIVAGFVGTRIAEHFERALQSRRDYERVLNEFGRHVSPAVVDRLLHQRIRLDGEVKHVCIMFLDIRGFTAFSDTRTATEVLRYLNTLFIGMIDIVNRHSGIVNKFLGDGFLAVFGAPFSTGRECRQGVEASLRILEHVSELNATARVPPTRIGIGLHAGEATAGNVGSALRQEYTVIGSVVNLASRIEGLNKTYGAQLLVSEAVFEHVRGEIEAEDLGPVALRGAEAPLRIFRLA